MKGQPDGFDDFDDITFRQTRQKPGEEPNDVFSKPSKLNSNFNSMSMSMSNRNRNQNSNLNLNLNLHPSSKNAASSTAPPNPPSPSPSAIPSSSPLKLKNRTPSYLSRSSGNAFSTVPPKVTVTLFTHEEVSSIQETKSQFDDTITSHVVIDGTVHAQILSSDAYAAKSPPLAIRLSDPDYPEDINYQFDTNFITYYGSGEFNTLSLPKAVHGQIKIASYQRSATKKFMPVLVQSKVIRTTADPSPNNNSNHAATSNAATSNANSNSNDPLAKCLLAIQIRSNLKNKGSLKDLIVVCAIPPTVISKTLKITTGQGVYDDIKRVIRWNVKELAEGNSLVFGAEVLVSTNNILMDELPKFPVLLRCRSTSDTISSLNVEVKEVDSHPVSISVQRNNSFRLLHRLPL